jgi:GNAT superfamily N-acetyltransferase
VKISKDRLRAQYLPKGAVCSYVRVAVDDCLAGNVFACRWKYKERSVCWITQLVVHREYRERGLAMGLLNELRQDNNDLYGIVSSHAAACLAAAKVFGSTRLESVS